VKVGDIVVEPAIFRGSVVSEVLGDGRVQIMDLRGNLQIVWSESLREKFAALEWTDTAEGQQCMLPGGVVVRRRPRWGPFVTLELAYAAYSGIATLSVETRDSEERAALCALLARSDRWRLAQEDHLAAFPLPAGAAGHRRGAL
jgi:hypothetical protein